MPQEVRMDEIERKAALEMLKQWAFGHPRKDRPFLVYMGQSLTPIEYFTKVQEDEDFRYDLLRLLADQAERTGEKLSLIHI